MSVELSDIQARVIGCLMEKSVLTPDQYPLTLNALTNACNQKSSRDPVMSLDQGAVQHAIRELRELHLVQVEENFKSQVEKYNQRLCNTLLSDYQFEPDQFAVMCVLLLRGPRTPGELRANSGRLHTFDDNQAVEETLRTLMQRDGDPLIARLPRKPGRRDHEYVHLFSGAVESAPEEEVTTSQKQIAPSGLSRLDRIEAKDEIRELTARYCHCVVDGDVDTLVGLFAQGGVFRAHTASPKGHDALREFYAPLASANYKPYVQNHVIELTDGEHATGRCSVEIRIVEDGVPYTQAGHYLDAYVKEQGRWRFAERHYIRYHHVPWVEGFTR